MIAPRWLGRAVIAFLLYGNVGCVPTEDQRQAIQAWLLCQDCTDGELESVEAIGGRAVSVLAEALRGPTLDQQRVVRDQLIASYEALQASPGNLPTPLTQGEYVQRRLSNFQAAYQARAAVALGRIGGRRARGALRSALAFEATYRPDVVAEIRTALVDRMIASQGDSQTGQLGQPVSVPPGVQVFGGSDPMPGASVVFRILRGGGSVRGARQLTDSTGIATMGSWILGSVPDTNVLEATAGNDTVRFIAVSVRFFSTSGFLTVFAGEGQSANVLNAVSTSPAVLALSPSGDREVGLPVTFTVETGGGSVEGGVAITDSRGVASVGRWILGPSAGPQRLRASSPGFRDTAFVAMAVEPPATMSLLDGDGQSARAGSFVSIRPAVRVVGAGGDPVPNVTVTFVATAGNGQVMGALPVTDLDGVARVGSWKLDARPGRDTLVASIPGLPDISIVAEGTIRWRLVRAGSRNTCGIAFSVVTYCWGSGGLVAPGSAVSAADRAVPEPLDESLRFDSIDVGAWHSCGLATSGVTYCWGDGRFGGIADPARPSAMPSFQLVRAHRFDAISVGGYGNTGDHRCGIAADMTLCWGSNPQGQLGVAGTFQAAPTLVGTAEPLDRISAGGRHTCGLTSRGVAYCWGGNERGQLGDGSTINRASPDTVRGGLRFAAIAAGGLHTCAIQLDTRRIYCWGDNDRGQLGDGTRTNSALPGPIATPLSFASLSVGGIPGVPSGHTCAIASDRTLYCWGDNTAGQLGVRSADALRTRPDSVRPDGVLRWLGVDVGGRHTCGITTDSLAYCWGDNASGQLGVGTSGGTRSWPVAVVQ